jgi:phosphotransferase system  glucose/maltose/N-acetylglucosamine-specific IIC component
MTIAWLFFGALIGISAAQRRGFSIAGGIIGGLMLGPLAVLMYFVSEGRIKCPQCAEFIKKEAKICPHCKSVLSAQPTALHRS